MIDPNILNEQDLRLLKAYLDNEEKLKAFIATYMYILAPGTGDGIMESQIIESEDYNTMLKENNIDDVLNEGILGNVLAFFKGKNLISKYYKGLEGAAKNYVKKAKEIENLNKDKKAGVRKQALLGYEAQVKSLDDVKSNLENLKKESTILSKYDQFASNKYKIKMVLSGRKAGVSMAKMSGYDDDLDKIKADQKDLKADIKAADEAAKKEKEEKEKADKEANGDEKVETPSEKEDKGKGSDKEALAKQKESVTKARNKLKVETGKLKKKDNLTDEDTENMLKNAKASKAMEDEIAKLEKQLKEDSNLPLSFFTHLQHLKEELKCLENSTGEKL